MKIGLTVLSALLMSLGLLSLSYAKDSTSEIKRTVLNKVKIINDTDSDMAYIVISDSENFDNVYSVKAKELDYYHAKATGDMIATIKIGECTAIDPISGLCVKYNEKELKSCIDNDARYDFYKVKSVKITSSKACNIVCNDNGKTSCRVK